MAGEQQPKEWPTVDGAPLNPYDLPGIPREGDEADTESAPTAAESAPVPGPGDPDTELVEIGGGEGGMATSAADVVGADPFAAVSEEQAAALKDAGFDTAAKIRAATDDELDAVDGIGPAAIGKLRESTRA